MDLLNDRYEIINRLGSRSGARLDLGLDRRRSRTVLVRSTPIGVLGLSAEAWARRQYQLRRTIRHPGFNRVMSCEVNQQTGVPLLVEEFVEGVALPEALEGRSLGEIISVLVQVCRALDYLHSRGWLHGNLHSATLVIGESDRVVLLDPLLVPIDPMDQEALPGLVGRNRSIFGRLGYQAPEVLNGEGADGRADIYSLGVVAHELLSGQHPFAGHEPIDIIRHQLHGEPVPLAALGRRIPTAIARIVQRMLARSPGERQARAADVILEINAGLGHAFPVESAATRAAYVIDPPTVGREEELARLRAALAAVTASGSSTVPRTRPIAVFVCGPPGVGKARLVTEAVREASSRGMHVLAGDRHADDPVLGPFAVWARSLAENHPAATVRFATLSDYLGGILDTTTASDYASARAPILDEAVDLLLDAATSRHTLIALGDVRELNAPSFDLLLRLIASCEAPHRLMIIASCDDERLLPTRREPVERLAAEGLVEMIRLRPFDISAVVTLLETVFEPAPWCRELAAALVQATGGVVSGVLESLRASLEEGTIVREGGHWRLASPVTDLPIPAELRAAVARRADLLDARARTVLDSLAELQRPVAIEELASLNELSRKDTGEALEELTRRGFVQGDSESGTTVHDLVGEVVRESLPPARRRAIHARALAQLQSAGNDRAWAVPLARHAVGARDLQAIRSYARLAAEIAAAALDYEQAIEWLDHALSAATDPAASREIALERCRLLLVTGRTAEAVSAYEDLVGAAHAEDSPEDEGRALLGLAHALIEIGDLERAGRVIDQASSMARMVDRPLVQADVREQLVRLAIDRGDLTAARLPLARSLRALRHHRADPRARLLMARLQVQLARLHFLGGRARLAERIMSWALPALDQNADHEGLVLARAHLAEIWLQQGRLEEAGRELLRLVAPGQGGGSGLHAPSVLGMLGLVCAYRGEVEQASGWLEKARTLAIASGNTRLEAKAEWGLGVARRVGLRHTEALGHFERSLRLHESLGRLSGQALALAEIGACYRAMGRLQSSIEAFDRVLAMPPAATTLDPRLRALCGRAEVERLLGMLDQAEADLDSARSLLGPQGQPEHETHIWLQLGQVHLQRGALAYASDRFARVGPPENDPTRADDESPAGRLALEALAGLAEVALAQGERFRAATLARRLLEKAQAPGRTSALAKAHILMAEALRGPPVPPTLEGHLTDAVLLAEASGDRELLREIAQRAARLREQAGQPEQALDLYERAAACVEEAERSMTRTSVRHAYHRALGRERAALTARRLREQLASEFSTGRRVAEPTDTLLTRLVELNQCQTVDRLLGSAASTLMTITGMPLALGLLAAGGTPVRMIGVGAAEGELLGSSRMEGVLDLARRSLSTGQVLVCADVAGTREYRELLARTTHPLRSFVCVPLHTTSRPGEVLGVLFSGDPEPLSLERLASTDRLATLARGIAGHLATLLELGAVERDRTVLSEERQTLGVLRRSAEVLGSPQPLDERLHAALKVVREATASDCVAVVDLRASPPVARWLSHPESDRYAADRRVAPGLLDVMLASGRSICVDQAHRTPPFNSFPSIRDLNISSVVAAPVVMNDMPIAAVYADRIEAPAGGIDLAAHREFIASFAQQIGSALVRDELDRELSRSRQQIETIFDSAPYPMVAVDPRLIVRAWNDAAERVLGYRRQEVVGHRRLEALLSARHSADLRQHLLGRLEKTGILEDEIWLQTADGREFLAAVTARAMTTRDGDQLGYTGIVRDLTSERNAQATIRRSEQIMGQLTDGVLVLEPDGTISYANPAAERLFGYAPGTLSGLRAARLWEGGDGGPEPRRAPTLGAEGPSRTDREGQRQDGSTIPIAVSLSPLRGDEGEVIGHLAIVADTSLRQRHEDELRRLSERVITAQEEERRRLARELHDESGQALAALHINLEYLASLLPPESVQPARLLQRSLEIIDQTQAEFRRLASDLHPAVLESFGLIPALRRYVSGLTKAGGLGIEVDVHADSPVPPSRAATALFRIAQEALTNVVRHAHARRAAVRLRRRAERIYLLVADDGRGFVPASLTPRDGIGIVGMRERAGALGGRLRIRSAPGQGCVVQAWLPLAPDPSASANRSEVDENPGELVRKESMP